MSYTECQGPEYLRKAIASLYEKVLAQEVVFLGAPIEGIFLAMQMLLEKGDHVVVTMPAYDSLSIYPKFLTGNVSHCLITPNGSKWVLDLDALDKLVTPATKLMVINFPHNPTDYQPSKAELQEIVKIAQKNNCWIFSDEMYRLLEWSEKSLPSITEIYDKSISLSGLSKSFGLPGLRAGWLIVKDQTAREKIINWKHYTTLCANPITEHLASYAIYAKDKILSKNRKIIADNLSIANAFFTKHHNQFDWFPPSAGTVGLASWKKGNATDYCHQLAKTHGILLLPASCMGSHHSFVRFGLGRKNFQEAIAVYDSIL